MSNQSGSVAGMPAPLVEVWRGPIIESRHRGHLTAVDGAGTPSAEVVRELARNQQQPNVLQNNCSGKHAAMLALARHVGAPTETYDNWTNPVQQAIGKTVSQFADIPLDRIAIGTDGCGVPVFGI